MKSSDIPFFFRQLQTAYEELKQGRVTASRIGDIQNIIKTSHADYLDWVQHKKYVSDLVDAIWYIFCLMFDQMGTRVQGSNALLKDYWIQNRLTETYFQLQYPEEGLSEKLNVLTKHPFKPKDPLYWLLAYCLHQSLFDKNGIHLSGHFLWLPHYESVMKKIEGGDDISEQESTQKPVRASSAKKNSSVKSTSKKRSSVKKSRVSVISSLLLLVVVMSMGVGGYWLWNRFTIEDKKCTSSAICLLEVVLRDYGYGGYVAIQYKGSGTYILLNEKFSFDIGQEKPNRFLEEFIKVFSKTMLDDTSKITVIGHSDSTGTSTEVNHYLAAQRAYQVVVLLQKNGIPSERLLVQSRGDEVQRVSESSRTAQRANRRIELWVED